MSDFEEESVADIRGDINSFLQTHVQLDHQTRKIIKLQEKLEAKNQLLSLAGSAKLIRVYENSLNNAEKYQNAVNTALDSVAKKLPTRLSEDEGCFKADAVDETKAGLMAIAEPLLNSRTIDKSLDSPIPGLEEDSVSIITPGTVVYKDHSEVKDSIKNPEEDIEDKTSALTGSDVHDGNFVSGVDEPTIESGPELDSVEPFRSLDESLSMPVILDNSHVDIMTPDQSIEIYNTEATLEDKKPHDIRARSSRRTMKGSFRDLNTFDNSRPLQDSPGQAKASLGHSSRRKRSDIDNSGSDDAPSGKDSSQSSPAVTIKSSPAQIVNKSRKTSSAKSSRRESPIPIGTEVAVLCRIDDTLENEDWILATILNYNMDDTFEVEDVEDIVDGSGEVKMPSPHKSSTGRLRFSVSLDRVRVIPPAESAQQDTSIKVKDRVIALFPGTTCLYPATVVSNPARRKKSKDYLVSFSDDSVQCRPVAARYVLSLQHSRFKVSE